MSTMTSASNSPRNSTSSCRRNNVCSVHSSPSSDEECNGVVGHLCNILNRAATHLFLYLTQATGFSLLLELIFCLLSLLSFLFYPKPINLYDKHVTHLPAGNGSPPVYFCARRRSFGCRAQTDFRDAQPVRFPTRFTSSRRVIGPWQHPCESRRVD